ncbi:MAG: (deoxy)nucleoside triphosphate pyrophosphohydrolase [Akkermansia sp.]|nr:(deoxy)nucleoside triphosphate pyrophosphohydrolase [Akkermansia sp.]
MRRETQRRVVDVVAALIFNAAGQVLATKCAPHKHGGRWEFPGGKIEPGESPSAAIEREIAEELGVHVRAGDVFYTVERDFPSSHLRMRCIVCVIEWGEIQLREHTDMRWLTAKELHSVDWLPADEDVLEPLAWYMSEKPSWWVRHSQDVLLWSTIVCFAAGLVADGVHYGVLAQVLFWVAGACMVMLLINYTCNRKLRRYVKRIQMLPVTQEGETAKVALDLMRGISSKDHYAHLPEHVRRKSIFGGKNR